MAKTGTGEVADAAPAVTDEAAAAKVVEESKTDAVGVAELPLEVFDDKDGDDDVSQAGVGVEAAPKKEDALVAEPEPSAPQPGSDEPPADAAPAEDGAPTEDGQAPSPEPEAGASSSDFDAKAFAEKYGVKDADLFSKCKDESEALEVGIRHAAHWGRLYGDQTQDVGALRADVERLTAELAAKPGAQAGQAGQAQADAGQVASATAGWTPEQREEFLQLLDAEPEKAIAQAIAGINAGAPGALTEADIEGQVEKLLVQREAARNVAQEREALASAHPDWETRLPEMNAVWGELGYGVPSADCYDLAGLRHQSPDAYAGVVAKMRQGISYDDARVLVIDHPATVASTEAAPERAASTRTQTERRAEVARETGTGRSAAATVSPVVTTTAMSVADLEDGGEMF